MEMINCIKCVYCWQLDFRISILSVRKGFMFKVKRILRKIWFYRFESHLFFFFESHPERVLWGFQTEWGSGWLICSTSCNQQVAVLLYTTVSIQTHKAMTLSFYVNHMVPLERSARLLQVDQQMIRTWLKVNRHCHSALQTLPLSLFYICSFKCYLLHRNTFQLPF